MNNMEETEFKRKISLYAILFYTTVVALTVLLTVCVNIYNVKILQAIPCYLILSAITYYGYTFFSKMRSIIFVKRDH
jgi:hypothetical protein